MITKTKAYTSSDGTAHVELHLAQRHELGLMFAEMGHPLIQAIVDKKAEVVDILTMASNSHPRARKINGAKRKPPAKPPRATSKAQATLNALEAEAIERCYTGGITT